MAESASGASSASGIGPSGELSTALVRGVVSSVDGVSYEVIFKTGMPYYAKPDNKVRRTQREFEWLCKRLGRSSFQVPFGESEDSDEDMRRLQGLLMTVVLDPALQCTPAVRVFLCSQVEIPLDLSEEQLQEEHDLLTDCTEDDLEEKSMEELRSICLRHGLSAVASFSDRDYFVERIVTHSQKQLEKDLDWLEGAVKSLGGGWMDVDDKITLQPTSTLCLPEIEAALTSIEDSSAAADALLPFEEPSLRKQELVPSADLPEDLLKALQDPYAAAMAEAALNLDAAVGDTG
eukprot:scpid83465/ scgid13349/ 